GLTVNLGDVPAGTSSTFLVVYAYPVDGGYTTAAPSAYFPPGFQIQQSATIDSPNATAPVTASATPVTWQIAIPEPSIAKVGPVSVRPDTNVTYTIRMGSGCFVYGGSGRIVGNGSQLCAESFTVVDELPEQAEFVSATGGGTYNADDHTVTWTGSGVNAAGGWGSSAAGGWVNRGTYYPRTVTVTYPASAFPEAGGGADFIVPVTNEASVTMTYLDTEETTKTASAATTHDVARITPFGRATGGKETTSDYSSGGQRYVNVPPVVTGMTCPDGGNDAWGRSCVPGEALAPFASDRSNYWYVDTYNRGNVPASAVVVDDDLGDSSARVYQIDTTATVPATTIDYVITNGTTSTPGTASGSYTAPAGSWITSATVSSGAIPAVNVQPSDTGGTLFRVFYRYELSPGAALGAWPNTATATVAYPGYPELAPIVVNSARTVTLRALPEVSVTPAFGAAIVSAVVDGGGQAVPGSAVTYTVRGATSGIPADVPVSPQYVFIAPQGWEIQNGSAAFAAGSVPPGAAFVYRDVTIGGVTRQAVIASWPTGTTFGSNVTWPNMTVIATPTYAVAAGTNSTASFWAGDSLNQYGPDGVTWGGRVIDAPDVDADGNTTEAFASATSNILVSGSDRIDVIKEICVETADGCNWVSNPDIIVGVAPDAEDITYRVTLRNGGNTTLSSIVGYDILPFVGDSRGSTFGETLNDVTATTDNVALDYSDSSNPCRVEVAPGLPSCDPDWTADATGAASIRAVVDGELAPGAEASFTFAANVVPGAAADAVACNSVAVDTANTVASEPRPVCATTQEADLAISVPDRLPLQAGRPGVVPFTVTNLGGSEAAPATVEIEVPEGIRITSLTPAGWSCEASETAPDGSVVGPVTLTCDAVTETGALRMLALDVPNALDLPAVIPDEALVGDDTCFPATVSGLMSDPALGNNEDAACFAVLAGDALIGVTKDDGLDEVRIGDEITYSIDVSNLLAGESLESVTITDVLPANLGFVSASAGGSVTDQGDPDVDGNLPGGTVTWTLPSLAPAGEPGADGDAGEGAAGSEQTVTVTVRVLQAAESTDEIVNEAAVSAVDPANPDVQLTDSDGDTDALLRAPAIQLVKSASPTTVSAVGDAVSYEFLVTNSGDVTLTDVAVTETAFSGTGAEPEIVCPADTLAPEEFVTCTASYEVTQADLDAGVVSNTATATGTAPEGLDAPVSIPSTAVVTADLTATISLVKTATPTTAAAAGDEIAYEFVVTNDGNVSVADVTIVEGEFTGDPAQLSDIVCDSAGPIAPDASVTCEATYTLTQADVDAGSVSNTATATADAPGSVTDPASDASTAVVTIPAAAGLSLEKTVSETTTADEAGETVTYLFDVSNTGNVTVDGIAIDERAFTGAGDPVAIVCPDDSLAPAGEMTCVGTYVLAQADVDAGGVDNTAAVTGLAPGDVPVESAESTADLIIEADATLELEKSASPGEFAVDEEVTYSFVVTNTGNVTVTDVAIDELAFTGSGDLSDVICDPAAASLAPDAQLVCQASYTITQADVDAGTLDNTAAAVGTSPVGAVTSDPSSAQLPFDQEPGVELVKTTDSEGYSSVGEAIDYLFRVTNTGNVTLDAVSIVEQDFSGDGTLSDIECSATALLPGQFLDCAASYEVTQSDIDAGELTNTAIAEAVAPGETAVASDASTVTVAFVGATELALTKSGEGVDANGDGVVTAGDAIRWTFVVTNTGASTLTALEIVDPMAGEVACDATVLAPGASIDCAAAEYRITAADAAAGRVVNTATATALGAGAAVVMSGEATAVVQVAAQPPLATTGGQLSVWLIVAAILALIAGAVALWIARARRRTTE
ncbi:MAG TPA: isopeptide-forming domain-containing fimbrial protein, partial [Rhodoglobus sp.]|nr:isopeptide-forming domain-containing fimbrial protein [Rhodoglobus sp.]